MPDQPDYAALAAQAERDHRAANERFQEAKTASEMASFRQVVFTCMAAGVTALNLEASDQGDHMSLTNVVPEEVESSELENDLWDGVSDLADYTSCDWAGQPGVTTTISHGDDQIMSATIDIPVAAEALIAATPEPTWTFVGHWDNDEIVVEYVLDGDVQDTREDTGFWDQGLFAASASGATQDEALAKVRDEYETN